MSYNITENKRRVRKRILNPYELANSFENHNDYTSKRMAKVLELKFQIFIKS